MTSATTRLPWCALRASALLAVLLLASSAAPAASAAVTSAKRWTDETPDAMVDHAKERATAPGASAGDVLSSIVILDALAERASYPRARNALREIAATSKDLDLRVEAELAERRLATDEGTAAGVAADAKLGVLTNLAVLGPFRDTGGGLDAREGPEAAGGSFADMKTHYAWGTVDVAWRKVPAAFSTATGVPLDVFVHPRKESCTLVASTVTFSQAVSAAPVVVRLAATGSARLVFDGVELARSEDVHAGATLDRMAGQLTASEGDHLIVAKVCTGALEDAGRVRLRMTDASGAPLVVPSSATLRDPTAKTKPRTARIVVPLERALAANGGTDATLEAAILRSLGGTDDLKSPRAPGLLDKVTRTLDLDADRMAMAGWVAPSGANRSGWLNLARAHAERTGDARTRTFTERRLAAEHLNARMPDWAMAAKQAARLDNGDVEATLLSALIDVSLGTDALRIRALLSLERAAEQARDTAPTALLDELARLARSYDNARWRKTEQLLAARGTMGQEIVQAMATVGAKEASEAAIRVFAEGAVEDSEDAVAIARTVANTGAFDTSRTLFEQATEWAPNVPEAWAGLAETTAAAPRNKDPRGLVALSLERARELAPGEARYRAELLLRQPPTDTAIGPKNDERYLVPSQSILARRQGVPANRAETLASAGDRAGDRAGDGARASAGNRAGDKPGESARAPDVADRELYWLRAVVLHKDRRVSQLIHYAREIVIAPRTQEELVEELPLEGDLTEILRARVHRKAGGTAFPTEEHNEGTRPVVRWPELEPGDVVEVAIRTWTSRAVGGRGDAPFYFLDYAGAPSTHPLLYNEVVVEAPKEHPIYLDVLHGQADRREERDDDGVHITRLIWDKPMRTADEPLSPALSEIVPMTVGSTFRTWSDFRTWYTGAVKDFSVPDEEVTRLAHELTRGKTTRDEKLRALFDFVADDIRYVNYVSGEWWLPNRPQQLLARREGDCDDKAILLITLLRAIGIEAEEVMVQTRQTGQPSVLLAKNAAIPMFDHGIAFLPGPGGGTYLDATSPQSRLGPLPSMDARAVAIKIDSGPAEIVHLPPSSPEDHGADVTWTLAVQPDGSGDLLGEEKHVGDGAFWLRTYLTEEGASRAEYVEQNLVAGWFPTVAVDKKVDFKGDLRGGAAWVRYRAHSEGLARHEQGDLVVALSQNSTLASQLAPLLQRTLPVSLPSHLAPSHQSRTLRVLAPDGYRWGDLPPGGDVNGGDFGRAHLEVAKERGSARAIVVKRTVVFDQSFIPVDKYGAWRAWIQRVDALMHKSVRLVPEGRGS